MVSAVMSFTAKAATSVSATVETSLVIAVFWADDFRAGMGAEAVKELLAQIDLEELSTQLHAELKTTWIAY